MILFIKSFKDDFFFSKKKKMNRTSKNRGFLEIRITNLKDDKINSKLIKFVDRTKPREPQYNITLYIVNNFVFRVTKIESKIIFWNDIEMILKCPNEKVFTEYVDDFRIEISYKVFDEYVTHYT